MWQITLRFKEVVKQTFTFNTFLWVRYVCVIKLILCLWLLTRLMVKCLLNYIWGIIHAQVHSRVCWKDSVLMASWTEKPLKQIACLSLARGLKLPSATCHLFVFMGQLTTWQLISSGWTSERHTCYPQDGSYFFFLELSLIPLLFALFCLLEANH